MVTNKTLNDCLAKRIGNAENSDGIGACIAELEKIGESPSETIETHVKTVLQPTSRPYLKKLINHCELSDASDNSSGVDLREKTVSVLQIPEWCSSFTDSIVDELSGWIERSALDLWRQGNQERLAAHYAPAWIADIMRRLGKNKE